MADSRIRLNVSTGELELEGSEAFIAKYDASIGEMLLRLRHAPERATAGGAGGEKSGLPPEGTAAGGVETLDFGEALHGLPRNATAPEQILLAAKFASKASADGSFTTGDANQLLIGQGVKLSNASQAMHQNQVAKRVFKAGGKWRLSREGEAHLKTLVPAG
jgi:hypothetical protein